MKKVFIKNLKPDEVEVREIEITVRSEDGVRFKDGKKLGDLVIKRDELEWCKGKTQVGNGKKIIWDKFIKMMESE